MTPGTCIEAPKETGRLKDAALLARLQAGLCLQGGRCGERHRIRAVLTLPCKSFVILDAGFYLRQTGSRLETIAQRIT